MRAFKVSKQTALALFDSQDWPDGAPEMRQYLIQNGSALINPEGVKLYAKTRGCVTTYRVVGYTQDGRDATAAFCRVGKMQHPKIEEAREVK